MKSAAWHSSTMIIVMLGIAGAITALVDGREPFKLAHSLDSVPLEILGWKAHDDVPDSDDLRMLKATASLSRDYERGQQHLGLFIAYYSSQRGGETMHSPLHCLPGNGWDITNRGKAVFVEDSQEITVNDDVISKSGQSKIMLYWYQSRTRIVANEFSGKLLLLEDAVLRGRTEGSLVRIVLPNLPADHGEAIAFAKALIPRLQRCFGETLN